MEKTRILIIDDDVHLSRLVAIMLDKTGTYASAVENRSHQALTAARRFRPELVLLDVDMPGFDGGDVARQFRADAGLRDVPIIFFTSLLSPDESSGGISIRGGERYLPKPVDPAVLIRSIADVLGRPVTSAILAQTQPAMR
jgi:DNA-binding response OmpR family regulator